MRRITKDFFRSFTLLSFVLLMTGNQFSFANKSVEQFTVANILQSNMVIQQGKLLKVWGTAETGGKILIYTDWSKNVIETQSDENGNWIAQVAVPKAKKGDFTKHTINVIHQEKAITLNNILIGEVWLCSGQSNMELTMQPAPPWHKGVENYKVEISSANYPNIRIFNMPRDTSSSLEKEAVGRWEECNPQTINDFSGVAYYFGLELLGKLEIPVGLVKAAYGGASCQAFVSKQTLESDTVLKKKYLDRYVSSAKEMPLTDRPSLMYNKMINPLTNLSIRGFLWYQGESNAKDKDYLRLCSALLRSWRAYFDQGDLPFYYVQMTPYNWKSDDQFQDFYAYFREMQRSMLGMSNTGMACTMDVGDPFDIHPSRKKQVGLRLAKIALNKTYGHKNEQYIGPEFKKIKIKKDRILIYFTKASVKNLLESNDGLNPRHFFVAGEDKIFKSVQARIDGRNIVLLVKDIVKPVAIRYAFLNSPVTNLQNSFGLPALPFRTDNWPKVTYEPN